MSWAYAGIVRPMFSYGSIVWAHELKSHLNKLARLNRLSISTFCPIPKSTPTKFLEIALDIMPLQYFCQQQAVLAYYRLQDVLQFGWSGKSKNVTFSTSHMKSWSQVASEIECLSAVSDVRKTKIWNNFFLDLKSFEMTRSVTHVELNVYTDGIKIDEKLEACFIIIKDKNKLCKKKFKLPSSSTVLQVEILAI